MSGSIDQILRFAGGVSDIHLKNLDRPSIVKTASSYLIGAMLMRPIHIKEYIEHMATERHRKAFNEVGEVDFSYSIEGIGRFRVNAFTGENWPVWCYGSSRQNPSASGPEALHPYIALPNFLGLLLVRARR